MAKRIEPLRLLRVAAIGKRIPEGRDSETYKATLATPISNNAYVKFCHDQRQPAVEVAASLLGRALGLNIPEPLLVFVNTARLPQDSAFHGTGMRWTFAAAQFGNNPMSVEHLYRSDPATYQQVLDRWGHYEKTAAFDEWIANDDRNFGNLVYSAERRDLAIIDHGRCLALSYWPESLADPAFAVRNLLVDAFPDMGSEQKQRLRTICNQLMRDCAMIDFSNFDADNNLAKIPAGPGKPEILKFLQQRIYFTVTLLCQRLGMPELIQQTH